MSSEYEKWEDDELDEDFTQEGQVDAFDDEDPVSQAVSKMIKKDPDYLQAMIAILTYGRIYQESTDEKEKKKAYELFEQAVQTAIRIEKLTEERVRREMERKAKKSPGLRPESYSNSVQDPSKGIHQRDKKGHPSQTKKRRE
ncbi:hypothetical protein C5B42_03720 [Candidatus Cerribacteria bacterium 'Amazon FNV 2010 28 9']|uniref:Uncharacterized protein n=1 Tax=Candidatus Cerribacteria bacterium 'Amazon FNV 2010 28 9' TaxID=2081795 RepID=A0A317JPX4_9BACT|nr:MAG: hypothetical protein C5B42_03720 [Candidatus Cerribacteria bacterium 'Amazon FNV 2010 28 9']